MSSNGPKLEKLERESRDDTAPTVIASGSDAGENVLASRLLLPAATTTVMPSRTALATARFIEELRDPPRLKLATAGTPAAWCSIIQFTPLMTLNMLPLPVHDSTRMGMMETALATP